MIRKKLVIYLIEECYLHVLDPSANLLVESEIKSSMEEATQKELETKMNKAMQSNARKKATFDSDNEVLIWIHQWKDKEITLAQFSHLMITKIFETKKQYGLYEASDVMIASLLYEERRYLMIMDNAYKEGLTHYIQSGEQQNQNDVMIYKTIFSSNIMKKDHIVIFELSDDSLQLIENKTRMEPNAVFVYADLILKVQSKNAYQDDVKTLRSLSEKMLDKYEGEPLKSIPKVKQMICDAANQDEPLEVASLAEVMFYDQPIAKQEFIEASKQAGVESYLHCEYGKPTKKDQVQKLKTDRGIEVIIPVDYMNSDYVEIVQNEDETITINLNYIHHIISR
ncbi:MAG: nucleoid-associated protein [Erysipelotrichaceae bacterium]